MINVKIKELYQGNVIFYDSNIGCRATSGASTLCGHLWVPIGRNIMMARVS